MTSSPPAPDRGAILVVDDEEPIGELLQQWLADEGYQTVYASCFQRVQSLFRERAFDLVTLDIMMPDADGLQVLRWIKQHHPDVGVVMATALGDLDTVLQAMRLGATGYLIKPFRMELITEEIGLAMERQRLIAENRSYQKDLEKKVAEQTRELRQAYDELSRRVRELEGRDRLVHFQMSGPGIPEACQEVVRVFAATLDLDTVVAYRANPDCQLLEPVAALGLQVAGSLVDAEGLALVPPVALQGGHPPVPADALCAAAYASLEPGYGDGGQAAIPLVYQDEVLGVLGLAGLDDIDREAAVRLGREAAVVLWSARVADDLDSGQLQLDELLGME
ncbi:MAG: response regulator [Gemmatimonadota bacterium]